MITGALNMGGSIPMMRQGAIIFCKRDWARFERALSRLAGEHQAILLLTYREHQDYCAICAATGVSVRGLSYKIPAARQALASTLDRLDLL
jgi:DNA-directed RNA polymerase specialized sigma24 family protein